MSTISAGTTSGTALVSAGNTDGTIQLRINGTTPSVTLAANGSIGVGSTPAYGTSGQVLQSAGSAAAPTWATPATGAMVYISTTTASGSPNVIDITSGFSSTYDDYLILAENITLGVIATVIGVRFYTASTLRTTLYMYNFAGFSGGATSVQQSTSNSLINTNGYQAQPSTTNTSASFWIKNANSITAGGTQVQIFLSCTDSATSAANTNAIVTGANQSALALTGIRIFWSDSTATFTSGTFRLYGIAKS